MTEYKIDPQEVVELYRRHLVRPVAGAYVDVDPDGTKCLCPMAMVKMARNLPEGETFSDLFGAAWSSGFCSGFDDPLIDEQRALKATPFEYQKGGEMASEWLAGRKNGLAVRKAVEEAELLIYDVTGSF